MIAQSGHSSFPIGEYEFPGIQTTPGSDIAVAVLFNGVQREIMAYTAPTAHVLAGTATCHKVCDRSDNITGLAVVADDLYLLANTGAIRGRVIKILAHAPELKTAKTVVPMGPPVVASLNAARDGVYATTMDGGIQRLRRTGRDDRVADVALPYDGSIVYAYGDTGSDSILFNLTGWVEPAGIWAVDAATLKATDTGINAEHGIGSTRSQTDELQADEFAFVLWQVGVAGFQSPG